MMEDFNHDNALHKISAIVAGKTIKNVEAYDVCGDDYLIINFTDGQSLRIRYDWIYEWEITGEVAEPIPEEKRRTEVLCKHFGGEYWRMTQTGMDDAICGKKD